MKNIGEIFRYRKKSAIFIVEREVFWDDIATLKKYRNDNNIDIAFIQINTEYRRVLAHLMIPPEISTQIEFYQHLPLYRQSVERIHNIMYRMLVFLEFISQVRLKIVLSGNINYAQEYHLIKAIQKKGGKFVALNKESIIYSHDHQTQRIQLHKDCNFSFDGDFTLLYNERAKETYIRAGAIKPHTSTVVGCPRVDGLVELAKESRPQTNSEKFILLIPSERPHVNTAPRLYEEVLDLIENNAQLSEKTIVKSRTPKEAGKLMMRHPNLRAMWGPIHNFLSARPSIVVAFSSTAACLDILFAKTPLIIPVWGDAQNLDAKNTLLGEHTNDFHLVAKSKNSLVDNLLKYLSANNSPVIEKKNIKQTYTPQLRQFLETYYSPTDGKSCERFFKFIQPYV